MSDEPKFPSRPPSRKSSLLGNGNGHKPHFAPPSEIAHEEERKANLKHAFFFLAVASLLILADRLGRVGEAPNSNSSQPSLQGVTLVLHPRAHVESQVGLIVLFRLSNMGNHSVFYPVRPGTNAPVGQIVTRTSPSSEWMTLSATSQQQWSAGPEFIDRNLAWIEMPPGGWVDGEFSDPGESAGDHAYAIVLKPERTAAAVRITSQPLPQTPYPARRCKNTFRKRKLCPIKIVPDQGCTPKT